MCEQLDAFPQAVAESPRIKWLRENKVTMKRIPSAWHACLDDKPVGRGASQDEAIIDLCIKTGLKHWTLKDWTV